MSEVVFLPWDVGDEGIRLLSEHGINGLVLTATVKIRRTDDLVPTEMGEAIDGLRHDFTFAWEIEEGDSRYPGEIAWMPYPFSSNRWPDEGPGWVASGDLIDVELRKRPFRRINHA